MNDKLTLREKLEQLANGELQVLMQEHIDWENDKFVPEDALLRQLAKSHFGVDYAMQMDRVASEVFRVYALRAAGMK